MYELLREEYANVKEDAEALPLYKERVSKTNQIVVMLSPKPKLEYY